MLTHWDVPEPDGLLDEIARAVVLPEEAVGIIIGALSRADYSGDPVM